MSANQVSNILKFDAIGVSFTARYKVMSRVIGLVEWSTMSTGRASQTAGHWDASSVKYEWHVNLTGKFIPLSIIL